MTSRSSFRTFRSADICTFRLPSATTTSGQTRRVLSDGRCGDFRAPWRVPLPPSGLPVRFYFASYRVWERFHKAPWQRIVRLGLVPVIMGLVIASGTVMARAADTSWSAVAATIAAAAITLGTRLSPMWLLVTGGALGGLGLL